VTRRVTREVRLARRPVGMPEPDDFQLTESALPPLDNGEVLVENVYMSVDPYMRGRMIDRKSYVGPFEVGEVMHGGAVGRVAESRADGLTEGDHVLSMNGWRERFVSGTRGLRKVDVSLAPASTYLGVMGMPGLTAYVGLLDIGAPAPGETVFVSGAAGAVGSVVCQIAKLKGCRVVGSAGSVEKTRWLTEEAGVDAVIDYRAAGSLRRALREACPEGIGVYFDNVGGDHLEAAIWSMNDFGRIVACGSISTYNAVEPEPGPSNLFQVVTKRLMIKGFIVSDHLDRGQAFTAEMSEWIRAGRIRWRETVVDGIESAPDAFLGLFRGDNVGKMLVRLGGSAED
jgi:NADPH-dependent curcumin reductase CurA